MKISGGTLLSSLCCSAVAAATTGHVFTYDVNAKAAPQQAPEVSPEAARLILAQRLGLSKYHSIENADDDLISHLNAYGGRQELFRDANVQDSISAHLLVWIEDVEDVGAIIKDTSIYTGEFAISNPPPASDNDRLVQDLVVQAEALPKKSDPRGWTYSAGIATEVAFKNVKKTDTYNDFLTVLRADKSDEESLGKLSGDLHVLLKKIVDYQQKGWSVTVVLMPPSLSDGKSAAHPYGAYRMPSSLQARRENPEAFLSLSSSQPSVRPQLSDVPDLEDFPTIQQTHQKAANDTPVLGILPTYFDTMENCKLKTHDCSGHGECKLLHKGTGARKDAYGCACKPTVVKVAEGKGMENPVYKTTYWGGPACQKKDVSQPFWLFVAAGVFLAGLISMGIGMLYSMGNEELPSVIGAGVSGPTRK
jgi:hypothetical protein